MKHRRAVWQELKKKQKAPPKPNPFPQKKPFAFFNYAPASLRNVNIFSIST